MSLNWHERLVGLRNSGQIVSSDRLLNELQRLNCRFRQRGSHITFHHDLTHTRGTIVYGTRKLWSQKTVAAALLKIQSVIGDDMEFNQDGTIEPGQTLAEKFSATSVPSLYLPAHLTSEIYQNDQSQVIVRDRAYPQIGNIVTPYDHPDIIKATVAQIAIKKSDFEASLSLLKDDADFLIVREGGVVFVRHPIHPVQALLGPYDPAEMQEPGELLEQCFDDLANYTDNQKILAEVIKSRRLKLHTERCDEKGVYHRTYIARRFQREFGVRLELKASQSGYVSDENLVGFLDDVDAQFFDSIKHLMRNNYGFEVSGDKYSPEMKATHPLLKELDFKFPRFESLPKLRDIYAKRKEVGEEAYIDGINRVLEQRDDILELVSYGLIFSVEQMMKASDTLYDIANQIQKITKGIKEAKANNNTDVIQDDEDMNRDVLNKAKKSLKKKFKKLGSDSCSASKPEYDSDGISGPNYISSIRNQKLPETFPYGRVMSMPLPGADNESIGNHKYMVIKGPDGKNLMIFSEEGMAALMRVLVDLSLRLPVSVSASTDGRIERLRDKQHQDYKKMIPKIE